MELFRQVECINSPLVGFAICAWVSMSSQVQ